MKKYISFILASFAAVLIMTGCKKVSDVTIPPAQAHFCNTSTTTLFINDNTQPYTFKVPVGVTTTSTVDRKVTISVYSKTAVEGTNYTISKKVVTIPAGQALDTTSVLITGIYAPYNGNKRKDTLYLVITKPDVTPSDYNDSLTVVLRGPCFDGDIDASALDGVLGVYNNDVETYKGGSNSPYGGLTIKSYSLTSATTATITFNGIGNGGVIGAINLGDVPFIYDWTDPNNITLSISQETVTSQDAGVAIGSNPNKYTLVINATSGSTGTLSVCHGTGSIVYRLGVYDPKTQQVLGYFSGDFATTFAR